MQAVVRLPDLPADAVDAAGAFYREHMALVRDALADNVTCITVVFPPASHDHRDWRRAAIASLARQNAPIRVNGLVGSEGGAMHKVLAWLAGAPGLTGQLLVVDGHSQKSPA